MSSQCYEWGFIIWWIGKHFSLKRDKTETAWSWTIYSNPHPKKTAKQIVKQVNFKRNVNAKINEERLKLWKMIFIINLLSHLIHIEYLNSTWNNYFSFSRQNCASFVIPWTVACQAPLSMGFSRQEYWIGCHFLSRNNYYLLIINH